MSFTVFYLNPNATEGVYAAIREELPPGWKLTTPGAGSDYSSELASCDFILVADRAITMADLSAAPGLRMIQHQGVGYDKIDLAACRTRGIPVALTPEGTTNGVAEHTLLLILALYKQLPAAANAVREGRWPQWELRVTSHELSGKALGLVGFGRIGREVARRASAFDANVTYFDPGVTGAPRSMAEPTDSLECLLRSSDIVSLHLPLTETSRHLINADSLSQMKRGAVLINTSRGELVDEEALAAALESGQLAGAGLDVLANEPPAMDHPLVRRPNVLITPHISAGTRDALATKMRSAFANMLRQTRGEPLRNLVEPTHAPSSQSNGR
jgi:phosphoglycerate dehydrogenase-like enzyme